MSLRITAANGRRRRLAQLALIPVTALAAAACGYEDTANNTGDAAWPNLFGDPGSGLGFPHEVVTTEGIASASLYLPIFAIAVVIFIIVEGWLLYNVIRFRRRSSGTDLPEQTHGNNKAELVWTALPIVTVFILFLVSTNVLVNDVESKSEEHGAVVDVQAFRFGWTFEYQDPASGGEDGDYQPLPMGPIAGGGRAGAPTLVLPVNEPILIRLTALDVIHSWYVPSFFFKRDAIPGRVNEFELTIERPGEYGGQCAEFCGLSHGDMFFTVDAREPADYEAWLAEQTGGGATAATEDGSAGEGAEAGLEPDAAATETAAEVDARLEIATTADKTIAFTTTSLEAPAGAVVSVTYTNDSDIPHNIAFYDSEDGSGTKLAQSEDIIGPGATATVTFTAPAEPGSYLFRCELHPTQMTGTLEVVA